MTPRAIATVAARLVLLLACVLTSLYALLGYIPFTSVQFLQFQMVRGLGAFATWHVAVTAVATLAATLALWPRVRARRASALVVVAGMTAATAMEIWRPLFSGAANDARGYIVALAALLPAMWVAALHLADVWRDLRWPAHADGSGPTDDARWLFACVVAGACLAIVDVALWQVRGGVVNTAGGVWIVCGDVLIAGGIFTTVMLARGAAARFTRPALVEFLLVLLLFTAVVTVVLDHIVFASIGFTGARAWLMAVMLAGTISLSLAAAVASSRVRSGAAIGSGLEVWLAPTGQPHGVLRTALTGAVLIIAGVAGIRAAAAMDWNALMQQLGAVIVWVAALAWGYGAFRAAKARSVALVTCSALIAPALWLGAGRALPADAASTAATFAPSFHLLRTASAASSAGADDRDFYTFLQENTNLPRDRNITPVDVHFVDQLKPTAGPKPNIFVIVLDSLRRDYLSLYNSAVTFTPAIGAFAAENVVFNNGFTRYGATGLSEPSIWTGGLLPHKQYVTPFAPMNPLIKLLDTEQYRQYVSLDTVLHTLLAPSPLLTPLDASVQNKDYDLCRSLPELTAKLAAGGSQSPVFVYTQPQTLHISSITREGASVPPGETYPGFYAPYASRLRRADGCFGVFVDTLKRTGQYDNSIIVLTADHGDSLGEDGRWGHAYTLYPEVVRIPLIVHLPAASRSAWRAETAAVAFSTDITPTLYALLGHPPTPMNDLFGRPLFSAPGQPAPGNRTPAMIVSSYGPVYALLTDEGRHLYIVDAINFQDAAYDLSGRGTNTKASVSGEERVNARKTLRSSIEELAAFYGTGQRSPER